MTPIFSSINGSWADRTVYIIGGGPSLKGFDFKRLKGFTLGVNDSALRLKTNAMFSMDHAWVKNRLTEANKFKGEKVFALAPNTDLQAHFVKDAAYIHWIMQSYPSEDHRFLTGMNSGFGALNLAYLKGAKKIVLMGFDMGFPDGGSAHWHAGYNWGTAANTLYRQWTRQFNESKEVFTRSGVDIVNAGMGSNIESFVKIELESLYW